MSISAPRPVNMSPRSPFVIDLAVFAVLCLGLFNMTLTTIDVSAVAFPLVWFKMGVASLVVWMCVSRSPETGA